ncbi:hypothetical protein K440DRAFT_641228 [Wilcoxina mikolae CBS 423.85]|nr:hypothetical protein K440DRAFT_641228 [Wilcoxina mikolae CBS 423.85]
MSHLATHHGVELAAAVTQFGYHAEKLRKLGIAMWRWRGGKWGRCKGRGSSGTVNHEKRPQSSGNTLPEDNKKRRKIFSNKFINSDEYRTDDEESSESEYYLGDRTPDHASAPDPSSTPL